MLQRFRLQTWTEDVCYIIFLQFCCSEGPKSQKPWRRCAACAMSNPDLLEVVYAMVTPAIRLLFDGRSTAYQRSLRSQW